MASCAHFPEQLGAGQWAQSCPAGSTSFWCPHPPHRLAGAMLPPALHCRPMSTGWVQQPALPNSRALSKHPLPAAFPTWPSSASLPTGVAHVPSWKQRRCCNFTPSWRCAGSSTRRAPRPWLPQAPLAQPVGLN